ncbi:pantetheine-phosphate adenylyltransferase [Sphingomonas sp.]|uniref:pantetheine-phosphate adenylyltransferase n=1 Tax=Sphingomonas sp. TaxID=28214 RepID=UPI000DB7002E|nr:pantetheine-phosphate adenylyltransferase [Sphingomonas sp.]PZU11751.1 MAG: pantetheine-phosphate adenylyltransferase [Sphingomonas sp.]
MSRIAVYPGTFDPPTLGHMDIIGRAALLFDRLVVGVFTNAAKSPLFTLEERLALLAREVASLPGAIEVIACSGLLVDVAADVGASAIVRGLRSGTDFDYEAPMAGMNRRLVANVDTVFLVAEPALQPISSTLVKEIARGGGDISGFVTPAVRAETLARIGR